MVYYDYLVALTRTKDISTKEQCWNVIKECSYVKNYIEHTVSIHDYYGLDEMILVHKAIEREEFVAFVESELKKAFFKLNPEFYIGKHGGDVWKLALAYAGKNLKESIRIFFLLKGKEIYPLLTSHNLGDYVSIRKATGYKASLSQHTNAEIMDMIAANPDAPICVKKLHKRALDTIRIAFNYPPEESDMGIDTIFYSTSDGTEIKIQFETVHPDEMYRRERNSSSAENIMDPYILKDAMLILSERERFVIVERFGLNSTGTERSLKELGAILGVSPQRVDAITKNALSKMRIYMQQDKISA